MQGKGGLIVEEKQERKGGKLRKSWGGAVPSSIQAGLSYAN
jgi:hypothetical protein